MNRSLYPHAGLGRFPWDVSQGNLIQQAVPVIYCPNLKCRTVHPEGEQTCKNCGATLPHRYLWVAGDVSLAYQVGDRLMDRYLFKGPRVVLDTQPGYPLVSAYEITDAVLPYLKLFPLRLHLPQVYSLLPLDPSQKSSEPLLLLEGAPIAPIDFEGTVLGLDPVVPISNGNLRTNSLAPETFPLMARAEVFTEAWQQVPALRQVHWLWQMTRLWTPLYKEGVAQSLVNPELLRVEGPLLRLLALQGDEGTQAPSLVTLGQFWTKWCLPYVGRWRAKFGELCDRLVEGQIDTVDPLIDELEAWLAAARATSKVRIDIATRTDSGPTREHNEDACYPHDGTVAQNTPEGLAIVCDGVGGHAGGEVASGIAISALTQHLQKASLAQMGPDQIMAELETAVGIANDLISQQNDQEHRHDRDRMGTTVVMAAAQTHDLYITNLGDSRAYLITEQGCYQVTTDDDIATREVRLGYLPYREALRQPGAGSLIQALGMVPSSMLRPAVHRFMIDSDCLFLLCSDGLSDFERVENLWQTELIPLLTGQSDLAEISKRLISAANRLNGHDNVTVGLIHCRLIPDQPSTSGTSDQSQTWESPAAHSRRQRKADSSSRSPQPFSILMLLGLLALSGGGAALGFWVWQQSQPITPIASPSSTPAAPMPSSTMAVSSYWTVQVKSSYGIGTSPNPAVPDSDLTLRSLATTTAPSVGTLTDKTIIQIIGAQQTTDQVRWLKVQVCQGSLSALTSPSSSKQPTAPVSSSPAPTSATPPSAQLATGGIGYIPETQLMNGVVPLELHEPGTLSLPGCAAGTIAPAPPVVKSTAPVKTP